MSPEFRAVEGSNIRVRYLEFAVRLGTFLVSVSEASQLTEQIRIVVGSIARELPDDLLSLCFPRWLHGSVRIDVPNGEAQATGLSASPGACCCPPASLLAPGAGSAGSVTGSRISNVVAKGER